MKIEERERERTNRVLACWISASRSFKESLKDLRMEATYIALLRKHQKE
jgi:hypothetical protein